ncbi:hypothetical protein ILYODFUR_035044, partial [Ilyodon furcidens]
AGLPVLVFCYTHQGFHVLLSLCFTYGAGVSHLCWVTGRNLNLLIIFVEHWLWFQKFLDDQDYLRLVDFVWISFPRTKLAASCFPPSPEPRHKCILSTLQRKYLNIELSPELTRTHSTAQVKPSGFLRFAHLDPDSLYPW